MSKSIFITGSSGGIGRGIATYFKDKGYQVIGLDIMADGANELDFFIQLDLNLFCVDENYRREKTPDILSHAQHVKVLVNNAAVQILGSFSEVQLSDWQKSMNVNLTAPMLLSQILLSELERNSGNIINIGSIHSQLTKPSFVSYATSKAALLGLTKAMAVDLRGKVRVNCISPAAIETQMLLDGFNGDSIAVKKLEQLHPVERIGRPKDIAEIVYFLAELNKGFLNGANLTLDGGISSVLHDI